jgi:HSP20 family protein
MPITPWRNLWEVRYPSLKEEMDKLFEDFFGRSGFPTAVEGAWVPALDVRETNKDVVVTMDIPAVNPKDVTISIVDDKLTIRGERRKEEEVREENMFRSERIYGSFQRTVQLPSEVVANQAKATYKDGVLKIKVPKSAKAVPKEIKVEIQ